MQGSNSSEATRLAQRTSSSRATQSARPVRATSARARENSASSTRLSPDSQASTARSALPLAFICQVGAGGVISDPELRAGAVLAVARRAADLGWHTVAATASPLPGPSGNVEYFLWLRARTAAGLAGEQLEAAVRRAVTEGPQ